MTLIIPIYKTLHNCSRNQTVGKTAYQFHLPTTPSESYRQVYGNKEDDNGQNFRVKFVYDKSNRGYRCRIRSPKKE